MKNDIFNQVLKVVSLELGVNEEEILSFARSEEVLDARAMVVFFCRKFGMSNKDIRIFFGRNGHRFAQNMYDLCVSRKQFSRYYSAVSEVIGKQLGIGV